MVRADDLNVFQFIPNRKSSIIGMNVMGKTLSIFFDNDPDSDFTIRGLIHHVHNSDTFKALGFSFRNHILGDPRDPNHILIHTCDDRLQPYHHIHMVYSHMVTPALIDLFVDEMKALENSPALRAHFPTKPFTIQIVNFLYGEGLSKPYNASKPIRYLFNDDKRALKQHFRALFDEGFMATQSQRCAAEPVLNQYMQLPMFKTCEINDRRPALPEWFPSSSEAHEQDLAEVRKLSNTLGSFKSALNGLDTLIPLLFIAGAIARSCCSRERPRQRHPHNQ